MADCVRCLAAGGAGLRHSVLAAAAPGDYKPALAQALSRATGQRVDIDELGGGWRHGHLVLFVRGVSVSQPQSGATQRFAKLELAPSLSSLWRLEPHFSRIALSGPVIHIRRDARGAIPINDIDLTQGSGDTALLDWLLRQSEVSIDQATLHWRDEFAGLAELTLTDGRWCCGAACSATAWPLAPARPAIGCPALPRPWTGAATGWPTGKPGAAACGWTWAACACPPGKTT